MHQIWNEHNCVDCGGNVKNNKEEAIQLIMNTVQFHSQLQLKLSSS